MQTASIYSLPCPLFANTSQTQKFALADLSFAPTKKLCMNFFSDCDIISCNQNQQERKEWKNT
jgi:hypothetical protein